MISIILTLSFIFSLSQENVEMLQPIISRPSFKESLYKKIKSKAFCHLEKRNQASFVFFSKLAKITSNNEINELFTLKINDFFFTQITKELEFDLIPFYLETFKHDEKRIKAFFYHLEKACESTWLNKKEFNKGEEFIDHLSSYCNILGVNSFETIQKLIRRIFISFLKSNDTKGLINIYPFCKKYSIQIPFEDLKKETANYMQDALFFVKKNHPEKALNLLKWILIIDSKNEKALNLLDMIS